MLIDIEKQLNPHENHKRKTIEQGSHMAFCSGINTVHKRSCYVCFDFTGFCLSPHPVGSVHPWADTPQRAPPGQTPPGQTPPWADTPWTDTLLARHPPPLVGRHTPGQTPPRADIPLGQTSPLGRHPPLHTHKTATAVAGTHPTGMHSC